MFIFILFIDFFYHVWPFHEWFTLEQGFSIFEVIHEMTTKFDKSCVSDPILNLYSFLIKDPNNMENILILLN